MTQLNEVVEARRAARRGIRAASLLGEVANAATQVARDSAKRYRLPEADVDDLAQEVSARFVADLRDGGLIPERPEALVWRMAENRAKDLWRAARRGRNAIDSFTVETATQPAVQDPEGLWLSRERQVWARRTIRELLEQAPDNYKVVLRRHYLTKPRSKPSLNKTSSVYSRRKGANSVKPISSRCGRRLATGSTSISNAAKFVEDFRRPAVRSKPLLAGTASEPQASQAAEKLREQAAKLRPVWGKLGDWVRDWPSPPDAAEHLGSWLLEAESLGLGSSVALAAALAFLSLWTGKALSRDLAATGGLGRTATVQPVGRVAEKAQALRQAAGVRQVRLLVATGNAMETLAGHSLNERLGRISTKVSSGGTETVTTRAMLGGLPATTLGLRARPGCSSSSAPGP